MLLTEEQVAALAPDPAALSAGRSLAAAAKWGLLARNDRAAWGEIKGSGSQPYRSQIDLRQAAFRCSCPSRKFPCKHGLALYLLLVRQAASFTGQAPEPAWVQEWLDKRLAKADPVPEPPAAPAPKKDAAKEKRQAKRWDDMLAGTAEAEQWLKDLVRGGLLQLPAKTPAYWQKIAARMVDAKLPGIGNAFRDLGALDYANGTQWQAESLQRIARLYLVLQGARQAARLPVSMQEEVKTALGVTRPQRDLLEDATAECIRDTWLVAGRQRETTPDNLTVQRDWLYGSASGRVALLLAFAFRDAPLQSLTVPGTALEADLVFYPAHIPLRAAVRRAGGLAPFALPVAHPHWHTAQDAYTQALARLPWAGPQLLWMQALRLVKQEHRWHLSDRNDHALPLSPELPETGLFRLLALTGGNPADLAVLRVPEGVLPLGVWADGRYHLV